MKQNQKKISSANPSYAFTLSMSVLGELVVIFIIILEV